MVQAVSRQLIFRRGQKGQLLVVATQHPGVLISAEEIFAPLHVKQGAVLISRRHGEGTTSELRWTVYNSGYYQAVRALAVHTPGSYDREESDIELAQVVLEEAVSLTWHLVSSSPEDMKSRYNLLMRALVNWRRPRLKTKRLAMATIDAASSLNDRRGRFNPTSRSPMVLSASLRFRRRVDDMVQIRHDVHGRLAALVGEKHRALKFLDENERMLLQTKSRWRGGRPPSQAVATDHAWRFREAIKFLEEPYVAPFGRRTFQRLRWDFLAVANSLEADLFDGALEEIDTALNSIYMVRCRANMEEALLRLTQLIETGEEKFGPGEKGDFYIALYEFRQALGRPDLEKGFVHPILPKVLQALDAAIAEIKRVEPDLGQLRVHLKEACEPI